MFQRDDIVYILENNINVRQAKVMNKQGKFYTIQLIGSCGAIRLPEGRLFESEEAAMQSRKGHYSVVDIDVNETKVSYIDPFDGRRTNKSPYDWETGKNDRR